MMKRVEVRDDWKDDTQQRLTVCDYGDFAVLEVSTWKREFTEACIYSLQYRTSVAELIGLVELLRDRKVQA